MVNFVLCDDNLNILSKLAKLLESLFIKHNFDAQIGFQSDKAEEILKYVSSNSTNVLILDINLKSATSGIELAEKVREGNKNLYLIFTTAHMEYVMIAYKVKTFDYLVKPITIEKLEETILRLFDDMAHTKHRYLKLGNGNSIIKQDDIRFIKREGMKLVFHTDSKDYESYTSFTKIQNCLSENFIRCHKSYIANVNRISDIEPSSNTILFDTNDTCFIGPKYKNNFMEVINYGNFPNNLDFFNHTK